VSYRNLNRAIWWCRWDTAIQDCFSRKIATLFSELKISDPWCKQKPKYRNEEKRLFYSEQPKFLPTIGIKSGEKRAKKETRHGNKANRKNLNRNVNT